MKPRSFCESSTSDEGIEEWAPLEAAKCFARNWSGFVEYGGGASSEYDSIATNPADGGRAPVLPRRGAAPGSSSD